MRIDECGREGLRIVWWEGDHSLEASHAKWSGFKVGRTAVLSCATPAVLHKTSADITDQYSLAQRSVKWNTSIWDENQYGNASQSTNSIWPYCPHSSTCTVLGECQLHICDSKLDIHMHEAVENTWVRESHGASAVPAAHTTEWHGT